MLVKDIIDLLNGQIINKSSNIYLQVNEIKIDHRQLKKNDLFIAIKGNKFDGHDFVEKAIKAKAVAIIIDHKIKNIKTNIPLIMVQDTTNCLLTIGSYIRNQNIEIPLIAITGSVGKTTTKELIASVLEKKYNVLKNNGNLNNHIGLPLTLFKLNKEYDVAVVELGMNHLGEVNKLSNCCKPDIGIITNIGTAHIGNLKTQKNIFKAKKEIIDGMDDGILLVNGDDKYLKKINETENIKILKCGIKNTNDFCAYNINSDLKKTTFNVLINDIEHIITLNIGGKHLVNNVLFAIYIGIMFEIDIEDIKKAIYEFRPVSNRMSLIELQNNITIIDDCYNSSYESLIGALEQLKTINKNKIIILGDILELGRHSTKIHKKIGKYLLKCNESNVLLVGNEMSKIKNKKFKHFIDNESLINYLSECDISNNLIMIKGSRKMHLEQVKEYILNNNETVKFN